MKLNLSATLQESIATLKLAMPLIAAFLAQKGMQLVDTLMMGWIGPDALAAGALGTGIFMVIVVFCRGTLSSVGIFIVRALGANELGDIKISILHGFYLAFGLSIPSMLLVWLSPYILMGWGQDREVVESVKLLLDGLVWGMPGLLLFFVLREVFAAFSLSRIIMLISLVSIPLTFLGNYLLIYGKFGLPALGIAGIGYAGAIVMWFMALGLWVYGKKHRLLKKHLNVKSIRLSLYKLKEMFYIGAPSGAVIVLDTGMFLIAAMIMGYFGVAALAAYQIAMQCASIAYNVPLALSVVTSMQVGHAIGSKNPIKARQAVYLGMGVGLIISGIIAGIFILFPTTLASPFLTVSENNYQEIMRFAESFLIVAAIFQCLDAVQTIANGALRGYKDTWVPMLLSIGCYLFLGIGSAYYFSFYTSLGAIGVWYGITFGICAAGVVLALRLFRRLKLNTA